MAHDISERPDPPRTRTLSFFLVLLFVVGPLWFVTPLSWVFVIYALRSGKIWSFALPGRALFFGTLCEVLFSVYHYHLARRVAGPCPYGPGNLLELQAAYTRVLKAGLANLPEDGFDEESLDTDRPGSPAEMIVQLEQQDPRAIDFRNVLRNWFGRVPWSQIRQREVYAWLYWSIFNTAIPPIDAIPHAHRAALDEALDLLQKRSGAKFPEGSNSLAKPLLLTLDVIKVSWRPFGFYATVGFANWALKCWHSYMWNIRHGRYQGLEYLLRVPEAWDPSSGPRPIVFIHGLGLGVLQYHRFLSQLVQAFPDRPLLVPLQPHISQDIFHPRYLRPAGRHEATAALAGLLNDLGWAEKDIETDTTDDEHEQTGVKQLTPLKTRKGVTMISHSNGSYFHAWVLKAYPSIINRSCFVDPVTFCSWEGDTCYSFIYRKCTTGIELIMRYFVSTELGVANLLQRHFDWSSNALWYEDIPNARDPAKAMFVLGGKDTILDGERVRRYLRSHGVRKGLWFDPNGRHGDALINGGTGHTSIFHWLQEHD